MMSPLRVAVGEDDVLLREGIARVLTTSGFEVVAEAGDADDLLRKGLAHHPDLLVADINMPPGHGDDGLRAALEVRRQRPETSVLVLSQYYEERYAADLLADGADGVGYLLKERVGRVEEFVDAATRVAEGGRAIDPEVVARMLGRRRKRHRGCPRHQRSGGREAHHPDLRQVADQRRRVRASPRARGAHVPARELTRPPRAGSSEMRDARSHRCSAACVP